MLTVDDVNNFRQQFSQFQNMAIRIVRHISTRFAIAMVPYLRSLMIKSNKLHAELFEVNIDAPMPTVRCTDTAEFLQRVCELRKTPLENCTLMIGIDRGDETLKISVTILENDQNGVPRGKSVDHGEFLTSGVRRILVLAAAAVEEHYDTVAELMKVLDGVDCYQMRFAVDHKMKSTCCGVAGGRATHWCTLCEYDNRDNDDPVVARAKVRTFESLRRHHAAYKAAMRTRK